MAVTWPAVAGRALAQVPAPPGPLSKAHASLITPAGGCETCHVAPGKIEGARCLKCHQPIAARIAAKKGVHREVAGDCEACHQEHQGVDADLRPLEIGRAHV
jgi:Zn-finger protein